VRNGNFDSENDPTPILRSLEKSAVAAKLRHRGMDVTAEDATPEDVVLYRAIIVESRDRLRKIWPGIRFHVIYWDTFEGVGRYPLFDDAFANTGIVVHSVADIFPPVQDWDATYKLRGDVHPNARAHDLMARYVVRAILGIEG
jgi:hypothetical protein